MGTGSTVEEKGLYLLAPRGPELSGSRRYLDGIWSPISPSHQGIMVVWLLAGKGYRLEIEVRYGRYIAAEC